MDGTPILRITSYHRSFLAPGGPVVWAVEIGGLVAFGRQLANHVIQLAESDDVLNKRAQQDTGNDKAVWDEATLIAVTREALKLSESDTLEIQKPPVVQV